MVWLMEYFFFFLTQQATLSFVAKNQSNLTFQEECMKVKSWA